MNARGIIFNRATGEVVARPWKKFFNLSEVQEFSLFDVEGAEFVATEKVDGSLGILFPYKDNWYVATKGSFISDQAVWATKWARDNINLNAVPKGYTALFEIIYPENRIIVNYGDREELVLLGLVDNRTGLDVSYEELKGTAEMLGVSLVPSFGSNNLKDIQKIAKELDPNKEGFVVTFDNGTKLKIKGDEYCRIHKLVAYMTPLAFWEAWDYNEDPKNPGIPLKYLEQLPEEFRAETDLLHQIIDELHWSFWSSAKKDYEEAEKHIDVNDRKSLFLYCRGNLSKKRTSYVMRYANCAQIGEPKNYWHFWFEAHKDVRPTYNVLPENDLTKRLDRIRNER